MNGWTVSQTNRYMDGKRVSDIWMIKGWIIRWIDCQMDRWMHG